MRGRAVLFAAILALCGTADALSSDTVLTNGKIVTYDGALPAEALEIGRAHV